MEQRKIICNKCESPVSLTGPNGEPLGYYGLIDAHVMGGYYSPLLEDGASYTFSLCEVCVKELMDSFKYPPHKTDYLHLAFMRGNHGQETS